MFKFLFLISMSIIKVLSFKRGNAYAGVPAYFYIYAVLPNSCEHTMKLSILKNKKKRFNLLNEYQ